ncbi:RyR domain-containing protein [Dactylosporangium sp. NPDC000555]|uniref:RyR domain-containing protein n=1 Tax=Dactylosporangium sp. NPDC000555 TaxID=3154260 RepID=UPI003328CA57
MAVPEWGGSRTSVSIVRGVFAVIGLAAFGLGWAGMYEYREGKHPLDVLYFVLQLYVLGSDALQDGGPFPWPLEVARLLAPLFTLLTVVETGRLLLANEVRRFRSRTARRHAVVCGDTAFAKALARQLFNTGHRVVQVRTRPFGPLELRHRRMLGVWGDARSANVLRAAGLRRARYLYVCGDDDQVNHAIAVAAGTELQLRRTSPWIYVQVNRQQTCHLLQARRLGAAGTNRFRLDYFHVDDVAARRLYQRHPLRHAGERPLRLLIAGEGSFPGVLLVETARFWRAAGGAPDGLHVDMIGPDAGRTVATLAARFPFLERSCRIRAHNELLDTWLPRVARPARYDRIYLCHHDEQRMLDLALESPHLWHAVTEAVFVATYHSAALADAFHGGEHNDLLDEVDGRLQVYPILTRACDARLITDDLTERLAREFHQRYLTANGGGGTASGVEWARLSESMRNANRAQVQGIAAKMRVLGCVIAVRHGEDAIITEDEIERLARLEHERWCEERAGQGWRHGPRDDRRRRHPDLIGWDALGERSREKARDAVRSMSDMLADEGFTIVRLNEPVGIAA